MNLHTQTKTKPGTSASLAETTEHEDDKSATTALNQTYTEIKRSRAPRTKPTKAQTVITLLRRKSGATIVELAKATGWQQHSVRGLISGTIKKKMLFNIVTEKGGKSGTRYRIVSSKGAK